MYMTLMISFCHSVLVSSVVQTAQSLRNFPLKFKSWETKLRVQNRILDGKSGHRYVDESRISEHWNKIERGQRFAAENSEMIVEWKEVEQEQKQSGGRCGSV